MDSEKIKRHIDHLQQMHDDLDRQIVNEFKSYSNDKTLLDLKKQKLKLKDQIESFKLKNAT